MNLVNYYLGGTITADKIKVGDYLQVIELLDDLNYHVSIGDILPVVKITECNGGNYASECLRCTCNRGFFLTDPKDSAHGVISCYVKLATLNGKIVV